MFLRYFWDLVIKFCNMKKEEETYEVKKKNKAIRPSLSPRVLYAWASAGCVSTLLSLRQGRGLRSLHDLHTPTQQVSSLPTSILPKPTTQHTLPTSQCQSCSTNNKIPKTDIGSWAERSAKQSSQPLASSYLYESTRLKRESVPVTPCLIFLNSAGILGMHQHHPASKANQCGCWD